MRLAVSNIAWDAADEAAVLPVLRRSGVTGLEVAPRKLFDDPAAATAAERATVRSRYESAGLPIVAMQALLFGRPELDVLADRPVRSRTLDYLRDVVALAGDLGAGALVFGSPRNRRRGALTAAEAWERAVDVFGRLGEHASRHGTVFCVEANPADYGCDFLTTPAEAADLVAAVGAEGFRLHLDAGGVRLSEADPVAAVAAHAAAAQHFHASDPHLAPVLSADPHRAFAAALREAGYAGWVSLEMRRPADDALAVLTAAADNLRRQYGD